MIRRTRFDVVHVRASPLDRRRGRIEAGPLVIPCALGRSGPSRRKREGDGATPVATLRVLGGFFRPDRMPRPRAGIGMRPLGPADGWCDDPADRRYNRPIRLPDAAGHERMWRDDHLYDVVLDLDWNRGPIRPGRGSAIFLHLMRHDGAPTEGCVAVPRVAIRRLLEGIGPRTRVKVVG